MEPPAGSERDRLPPPAIARSDKSKSKGSVGKKTTFDRGLKVRWARWKHKLGTGSSPSMLEATAASSESMVFQKPGAGVVDEEGEVDEVVVDNSFAVGAEKASVTQPSEYETGVTAKEKSGPSAISDRESTAAIAKRGIWERYFILAFLRWRLFPPIRYFFTTEYPNAEAEKSYHREVWYATKMLSLSAAFFMIAVWALGVGIATRPLLPYDTAFLYGVAPLLHFPLPVFVLMRMSRRRPIFYQIWISCTVWSWAWYQALNIRLCGFYRTDGYWSCNGKDFMGTMFYSSALPVIGLFALHQTRLSGVIFLMFFVIAIGVLILPDRPVWSRNLVNILIFHSFLLFIHYMREQGERHLFHLRTQVKEAFLRIQKAQVNERKASESKRRLTSYIFHEVRVPLNTAMLAVQNMEASDVIAPGQELEFAALQGSLSVMSKVLNDVLDLNRMDAGKFESVNKPYNFHMTLRSMLIPLKLAADARGLEIVSELDKNIDLISRRAMYQAAGDDEETILKKLEMASEDEGIVVGDEIRLRQVITNITSNACKFTQEGGRITVRTKLVWPSPTGSRHDLDGLSSPDVATPGLTATPGSIPRASSSSYPPLQPPTSVTVTAAMERQSVESGKNRPTSLVAGQEPTTLSVHQLNKHNASDEHHRKPPPLDRIVVRIEVQDTGLGIRARDLHEHRLFSPYVQTEIGRYQGGKGSGLGLALVRHIIKLTGGRLGVKSKVGEGSTFWVELALGVGVKARAGSSSTSDTGAASDVLRPRSRPRPRRPDPSYMPPNHEIPVPDIEPAAVLERPPLARADDKTFHWNKNTYPGKSSPHSSHKSIMEQHGSVELLPRRPGRQRNDTGYPIHPNLANLNGTAGSSVNKYSPFSSPATERSSLSLRAQQPSPARSTTQITDSPTAVSPQLLSGPTNMPYPPSRNFASDQDTPPTRAGDLPQRPPYDGTPRPSYASGHDYSPHHVHRPSISHSIPEGDEIHAGLYSDAQPSPRESTSTARRPSLAQTDSQATPRPYPDTSSQTTFRALPDPTIHTIPQLSQEPKAPDPPALPASPVSPTSGEPGSTKPIKPPPEKFGLNVLVVDDDAMTRALFKRLLQRLGCNVTTADNGAVALEYIMGPLPEPRRESNSSNLVLPPPGANGFSGLGFSSPTPPPPTGVPPIEDLAIVFLDNQMPIMSGLEAVARLRAAGRSDFVVGVTGNALLSDQDDYLDAGVDHVLTKPVMERSIKEMLYLAIERRKSLVRPQKQETQEDQGPST